MTNEADDVRQAFDSVFIQCSDSCLESCSSRSSSSGKKSISLSEPLSTT